MSTPVPRHQPIVSVTGNPRAGSRTLGVARRVAAFLAAELPDARAEADIDLATIAAEIFAADRPRVGDALAQVATAGVVVLATPVYKASFTGLLKSFLDGYGPDGLAGVVVVPVVVTGSPVHALVGETQLRPVLVELGAVVPTRSLVVVEADLGDLDRVVAAWWQRAGGPLAAALGTGAPSGAGAPSTAAVTA